MKYINVSDVTGLQWMQDLPTHVAFTYEGVKYEYIFAQPLGENKYRCIFMTSTSDVCFEFSGSDITD